MFPRSSLCKLNVQNKDHFKILICFCQSLIIRQLTSGQREGSEVERPGAFARAPSSLNTNWQKSGLLLNTKANLRKTISEIFEILWYFKIHQMKPSSVMLKMLFSQTWKVYFKTCSFLTNSMRVTVSKRTEEKKPSFDWEWNSYSHTYCLLHGDNTLLL